MLIQWNAENRTSENRTTPKTERNGLPISDVRISDIRAVRTTRTSLNVQKAARLDHLYIYNGLD